MSFVTKFTSLMSGIGGVSAGGGGASFIPTEASGGSTLSLIHI